MKAAWTAILVVVLGTALFAQTPAERGAPGWEGVAIVVDRHNPVNNISVTQLREMLFGDRLWWAHNRRITLVTLPRGSAERETVLRSMYKMDERSFEKFFFFGVYRGELANGPTTLASASEVKKFVSLKPGSLAYLRASDVDSSVKVLRIDGLLPNDDGYPLRLRTRKFK